MDSLCGVRNKIMYALSWWTVSVLTRVLFWYLFPSLLRNSGNKHQNNPLVSAETIRHSSTYIILYILAMIILKYSQKTMTCTVQNKYHDCWWLDKLGQYHNYWCSGSLHYLGMNSLTPERCCWNLELVIFKFIPKQISCRVSSHEPSQNSLTFPWPFWGFPWPWDILSVFHYCLNTNFASNLTNHSPKVAITK